MATKKEWFNESGTEVVMIAAEYGICTSHTGFVVEPFKIPTNSKSFLPEKTGTRKVSLTGITRRFDKRGPFRMFDTTCDSGHRTVPL